MAQAKRKPASGGRKKSRGWLLLLIGLGIGIAAAYLGQLMLQHNLHHTVASWFKREKPTTAEKVAKQEPEKHKSRFDFYTILPETETVLTDRDAKKTSKASAKTEEGVSYILQAASFGNFDDADNLKAKLALQGLQAQIQKVSIEGKGDFYRVRLGPYEKLQDLDAANQQLAKMGIKAMPLRVKKGAG